MSSSINLNSRQRAYKNLEYDIVKLEEDIFNIKSNIELRTSQLSRLKIEISRVSSQKDRLSNGKNTTSNNTGTESIFSSNNYGVSTLSQPKKVDTRPVKNRNSTGGPKVKTDKPYCTLV